MKYTQELQHWKLTVVHKREFLGVVVSSEAYLEAEVDSMIDVED